MTKQENQGYFTKDEKTLLHGILIGMLLMSQIAGILENAGYRINNQFLVAQQWGK